MIHFTRKTKIYVSEMTLLLKLSQHAARKELRQKQQRFLFAWKASVREKQLNAAWKIYESGPFHCEKALAGSTGSSLANERKIYASEKRSYIGSSAGLVNPLACLRLRMKILLKAGNTVVCRGGKYHCNSHTNVLCVSIFVIIDA